ncbi:hypothetical protein [Lysobacter terrae]
MRRYSLIFLFLLTACAEQYPAPDCSAVDRLLDAQKAAIATAQRQLDGGQSIREIQQGLGALVAQQAAAVDLCREPYQALGNDCQEAAAFGRLQDVGGLLRALHEAQLSEAALDRGFVQRMLKGGRDEASKPLHGQVCGLGA